MITRILVATDGSDASWRAVKYAAVFASQIKASITLLSVIDRSSFVVQSIPAGMAPSHVTEPLEDYLREAAEAYIAKAEKFCTKHKVSVESVIRSGQPVQEILKQAKKSKANIIVIGSHGKGTLEAAVLGSVTLGLIQKSSSIPVLVVRQ